MINSIRLVAKKLTPIIVSVIVLGLLFGGIAYLVKSADQKVWNSPHLTLYRGDACHKNDPSCAFSIGSTLSAETLGDALESRIETSRYGFNKDNQLIETVDGVEINASFWDCEVDGQKIVDVFKEKLQQRKTYHCWPKTTTF